MGSNSKTIRKNTTINFKYWQVSGNDKENGHSNNVLNTIPHPVLDPDYPITPKNGIVQQAMQNGPLMNLEGLDELAHAGTLFEFDDAKDNNILHLFAKLRNYKVIERYLGTALPFDLNSLGQTPLHLALLSSCKSCTQLMHKRKHRLGELTADEINAIKECNENVVKCVQLLMTICVKSKKAWNLRDLHGETPAGLAASHSEVIASIFVDISCWNQLRTKTIYDNSRDVDEFPLCPILEKNPSIITALIDNILDEAITPLDQPINKIESKVQLDFKKILPRVAQKTTQHSSQEQDTEKQTKSASSEPLSLGSDDNQKEYVNSMEFLNEIVASTNSNREQSKLLNHPLICAFLYLKWQRFKKFAWFSICYYFILSTFISLYVVNIHIARCSPKFGWKYESENELNESEVNKMIIEKLKHQSLSEDKNRTLFQLFTFGLNPLLPDRLDNCNAFGPKSLLTSIATLIMMSAVLILEIVEICIDRLDYFKDVRNWTQWILVVTTIVAMIPPPLIHSDNLSYIQYQAAAFSVFSVWSLLLMQLGKIPTIAVYTEMMIKVAKDFGWFLLAFGCILIGFAFAFALLLANFDKFKTIPRSQLAVVAMMVGDLDYHDYFYKSEGKPKIDNFLRYPVSAHLFYFLFIFLVTCVLFNLMMGLAVSDVGEIRKEAELIRQKKLIKEIYLLEKFFIQMKKLGLVGKIFFVGKLQKMIALKKDYSQSKNTVSCCNIEQGDGEVEGKAGESKENVIDISPNDKYDKTLPRDLKLHIYRVILNQIEKRQS